MSLVVQMSGRQALMEHAAEGAMLLSAAILCICFPVTYGPYATPRSSKTSEQSRNALNIDK